MRKLLLLNALAFLIVTGHAQDADAIKGLNTASADTVEGWKKGVNIFINFSQTSLTNWSAGGQSSFAGSGLVNMFANYKKGNTNWDNTLDIGLGALKQNGDDGFVKTDDKIDLASKYGYKAFTKWNYAALFNFKT